jgi:hypothetical protein
VSIDKAGRLARCVVLVGELNVPVILPSRSAWDLEEGSTVTVSFGPQSVHVFAIRVSRTRAMS